MLDGPDEIERITAMLAMGFVAVVLALAWWLRR
jgi:hypothetical protein